MYRAVTDDIEVTVQPDYLEDRSDPEDHRYLGLPDRDRQSFRRPSACFALLEDHRRRRQIEEVSGPGVVGEQPELEPGDTFQYTSGCPLSTPSGIMVGRYAARQRGRTFEMHIPPFSLDLPDKSRTVN